MTTLAFASGKGGVGKTTLVYHLAWMFAEHGVRTLAIDLDPQANLSALFLDEGRLDDLWQVSSIERTIFDCVRPLLDNTGQVLAPHLERVTDELHLVVGDIALATFEDLLSESWTKCLNAQESAFRVTLAFHEIISNAMARSASEVVLIDLGSGFSAINRSALLATDGIILPVVPDVFAIKSLESTGSLFDRWRAQWLRRAEIASNLSGLPPLPSGGVSAEGYVVVEPFATRRSAISHRYWLADIPSTYSAYISHEANFQGFVESDPNCLGSINHYVSLVSLARQARLPMFSLKPADGAVGSHVEAVEKCYRDFLGLARNVATRAGIELE